MRYVEFNLKIPEIKAFNEGQLGTLHIDRALDLISDEEIT